MPTDVLTIDQLCEKLRDVQQTMRDDGEEPVVLLGDIMGRFDVATPHEPNYSNMRVGDAGFSPDVFANTMDNGALTSAKDAFLHTIIVTEDDLSEVGLDLLPDDRYNIENDDESEVATDGGVTFTDLHAFKRDLLYAIRDLERDEPPKGLTVKRVLEDDYETEINHSRLYQNLDHLVESGLLDKGRKNGRTNEYRTTDATRCMLEAWTKRRVQECGLDASAFPSGGEQA
ncbi:PadR family transcriptional regulator [Haladaptatus sp. AB618]|uniref:helix-turn-helix transcriptional regulator n=1 Tax=Haladaptatus sp. AB618 TaxID=2934173 RepID=UPI00209C4201|nr:helix-turn-helix transcriptional regulator [Haladaptatus sp. AB618]MCO8254516.1 PadR family transcriptional regulator [Haladaptatus sp. AB618]